MIRQIVPKSRLARLPSVPIMYDYRLDGDETWTDITFPAFLAKTILSGRIDKKELNLDFSVSFRVCQTRMLQGCPSANQ